MKGLRYIVLVLPIVMISCLPDPLPVGKIPQLDPKIVVSSQVIPDQSVAIFLTQSMGALEASGDSDPEELLAQIAINDAEVIIYNEAFADTLEFLGLGLYASVSIPMVEGEHYSLQVTSPSMGTVTSTAEVKTRVLFESLEGRIHDTGFDTLAHIEYSLNDPVGRNQYMVNVQRITGEFEPDDFLNPRIFTHLVEDDNFDGQLFVDEFKVFGGRDFVPGDTIGVFLSNISEEYFRFMELRLDSRFNFSDFIGEPVRYPSNIEGGLGYFNLHVPDVRILVLE